MRKLEISIMAILLLLCVSASSTAAIINQTISARITAVTGSIPDTQLWNTINIFSIEYDDTSTVMHEYYDDPYGDIAYTYDTSINTQFEMYADATITLAPYFVDLRSTYGGYDDFDRHYMNVSKKKDAYGGEFYVRYVEDDLIVWMNLYLSGSGSGTFEVRDGDTTKHEVYFDRVSMTVNPVPIPSTMLLLGFGILGLAGVNRRKK